METPYRKDCSEDLAHVRKGLSFFFKSGRLSTNIKPTLYIILMRSVMTYTCPTWEYAADTNLLKLKRLQNRVLRSIGNPDRCTPVR
jgi:hypothetical protein